MGDEHESNGAGKEGARISFRAIGQGAASGRDGQAPVHGEDSPVIVTVEDVPKRGTCIVCHEPVFEYDKDLFTCPNCSREAHFLCATIFVTEHGICPVCSTRLQREPDGKGYSVRR